MGLIPKLNYVAVGIAVALSLYFAFTGSLFWYIFMIVVALYNWIAAEMGSKL